MRALTIISILVILISQSGCGWDCVAYKTGGGNASQTPAEARKNKVFRFEMQADKTKFMLDSGVTFKIVNAWVENSWGYVCIDNDPVIERRSPLQLVIEARYNSDHMAYSDYWLMKTDTTSGSRGSGLYSRLDFHYSAQDTYILVLTKQVHETNNYYFIGLDTIRFVKR